MFAPLKNKIREETGSDVCAKVPVKCPKLPSGKKSGLGSNASSMNSLNSAENSKEECVNSSQYILKLAEKDQRISALETDLAKMSDELALIKRDTSRHQQENAQIEALQSQELTKIKLLIREKDQELTEKTIALKEANFQLEKLKFELGRLHLQEEQLANVQDELDGLRRSSALELSAAAVELARCEEERRHLSDLLAASTSSTTTSQHQDPERKLLELRLEEAHVHLADIKASWSEKIASLETQVGRLSRQAAEEADERRRAIDERDALADRCRQLEDNLERSRLEAAAQDRRCARLEAELDQLAMELRAARLEAAARAQRTEESNEEQIKLRKSVEKSTMELSRLQMDCILLQQRLDAELTNNKELVEKLIELRQEINNETQRAARAEQEKDDVLMRNAQLSQNLDLAQKELRDHQSDQVTQLEEKLLEKSKHIRLLQMKITELKKSHHSEMVDQQLSVERSNESTYDNDINFKYLKHVMIKFLTSRGYEAQHLTRAVATLLKLSAEEERLLQETVAWKSSWFGSIKTIRPS